MSPTRSAERAAVPGHGTSDPGGTQPPGSPAIHTIELSKRYRAVVALAGLSMTVARGEVFGFLGPNGAGKTTAVKLLLGLARPTGGEAMVLGAPAGDLADPAADRLPAGAFPLPELADRPRGADPALQADADASAGLGRRGG